MTRRRAKAPSQRQLRVGEELRHALSRILARGGLRDPELTEANITVTEVRMSPDLKNATAFVVPFGGGDPKAMVAALRRAAPFFRAQLGREVELRYTPQVRFEADTSFDEAERIEALLSTPRVRHDLENAPSDENPDADANDDEQ
ncbi:30S ribosome-binding factor RbfA [Ferruginivarius sediminum]|uniref:Ribosome-binding factor A n=1 Tax=Ferruginivarius sediminum TaxID=2661937 RepID=A0A369TK92_9PROT|nr:30S ribosome-binding factor RbfA [Ferruginivarius sediminum]RDD63336.1 30S ribosome-binding factor RbfA [Ferruginivarius sediminum]